MFAYCAAVRFDMHDLASKAMRYIKLSENAADIFQVLSIASYVYCGLPEGKSEYSEYLGIKIAAAFKRDEEIFLKDEFLQCIGKSLAFTKFLTQTIVLLYSSKLSKHKEMNKENEPVAEKRPVEPTPKLRCLRQHSATTEKGSSSVLDTPVPVPEAKSEDKPEPVERPQKKRQRPSWWPTAEDGGF